MPSMFSLEGKNAAIVGGGSGIGEAVAIACGEQGAYVRCLDVKLDAATETAATIRHPGRRRAGRYRRRPVRHRCVRGGRF